MANPLLNPSAFLSLSDVCEALGKNGKPAHFYKAKAWLAERGIAPLELGPRAILYDRAAVEGALAGKPAASAPTIDPAFDPNGFVSLAAVRRLLGAGKAKPYDNRRTLVWLIRAGVPVFRPTAKVALIPKAELARAIAQHTAAPQRPMRRNRHQGLPPFIRSRAQEASQAKATQAASEARSNPSRQRAPRLAGAAAVDRRRALAPWARDARKAERAGRTIPPVPEIDHSLPTAPQRAPAPSPRREARPLNTQPNSRKYSNL